jgi:hypothetical protein
VKIAVVAGGWHWPYHFFREIARQNQSADLFVVAHRHPELDIVRTEKLDVLRDAPGPLGELDRRFYSLYASEHSLADLGWYFMEAPNVCGDWCFLNQWLEKFDYRPYDVVLSCHDDTYIRRRDLFEQLAGDWLILANCGQPSEPPGYLRGSFEFFKREMLGLLGGKIDIGMPILTRVGASDSPKSRDTLASWNETGHPLRRFLVENGVAGRISRLSPHYRVSPWALEGERGYMHSQAEPPWTMVEGLEAYPL